jgi:hypothetical protein
MKPTTRSVALMIATVLLARCTSVSYSSDDDSTGSMSSPFACVVRDSPPSSAALTWNGALANNFGKVNPLPDPCCSRR